MNGKNVQGRMQRAHVVITGDVQGVGFRSYVRRKAEQLGLAGWVRNRDNGSVEAVFEGDKSRIEEMIAHCKRGPVFSHVDDVDVVWKKPEGLASFAVRF